MAHSPSAEWQADVKIAAADPHAADPAMLPVYTPLPTSPDTSPASSAVGPNDSASNVDSQGADGLRTLKLFWNGLLAITLPPAILAAAVLASAGVMVYGCGKMLEGIGRGLAYGPEKLYKVSIGKKVKQFVKAWKGRRAQGSIDVEAGAIAI